MSEQCDHAIGTYYDTISGLSIVCKSDIRVNRIVTYSGFDPFKFCPDCGEKNETKATK